MMLLCCECSKKAALENTEQFTELQDWFYYYFPFTALIPHILFYLSISRSFGGVSHAVPLTGHRIAVCRRELYLSYTNIHCTFPFFSLAPSPRTCVFLNDKVDTDTACWVAKAADYFPSVYFWGNISPCASGCIYI